jgi:hypothetical protein
MIGGFNLKYDFSNIDSAMKMQLSRNSSGKKSVERDSGNTESGRHD